MMILIGNQQIIFTVFQIYVQWGWFEKKYLAELAFLM